jgi:pilus assembly protein Flp/PilA
MKVFIRELVSFLRKEEGPTSVEYAVMLSLIVGVCIVSITSLGSKSSGVFTNVASKVAVS